MRERKKLGRKLLVASVGVAVVGFSACSNQVVGNLMAVDAAPPTPDAGSDAKMDAAPDVAPDAPAGDAGSD